MVLCDPRNVVTCFRLTESAPTTVPIVQWIEYVFPKYMIKVCNDKYKMNYKLHYDILISRAKDRELDSYVETHHIIPKCIGGTNDKSNLVCLTPEEHYVAHQLLIKLYPSQHKLVNAAIMMCVGNTRLYGRSKNKLFGWLRRRLAYTNSINNNGENNSQFGTLWIYNSELNISKKIKLTDLSSYIENGWIKGRNLTKKTCECCNKEFITRISTKKSCSKECQQRLRLSSLPDHPFSRGLVDDADNSFKSLSAASRHYMVNIETIRYRIKIGKYKWLT